MTLTGDGLRLIDLEGGEDTTVPIDLTRVQLVQPRQPVCGLRIIAWISDTGFDLLDETARVLCHVNVRKGQDRASGVVSWDGTRLACFSPDRRRGGGSRCSTQPPESRRLPASATE